MVAATTDDLAMSIRPHGERRSYSDSFQLQRAAPQQLAAIQRTNTTRQAAASDSAEDEIQVIDDQQVAIPIRPGTHHRQSDRHSDLDIGSVHLRKRRSSPLFERRKRDDLDLLGDFSDSSDDDDDEDERSRGRDQDLRGRARRTKLLHSSRQTSPSQHHQQHYDYEPAKREAYPSQLGHHIARGCSPHGRHPLAQLQGGSLGPNGRTPVKKRTSKPMHSGLLSGLEPEALVFDNFEDASPGSSISEQEQENQDPFDAHLHFVRPAMPICANPGAFAALEPYVTPASSPRESLHDSVDTNAVAAQQKPQRLGHHRTVSEMLSPTSGAKSFDVRSPRRRATVGAEAAFRLPMLERRPTGGSS